MVRYATVVGADRIVVLDGGVISERGSHEELLRLDGLYARMFHVQAKQYESSGAGKELS